MTTVLKWILLCLCSLIILLPSYPICRFYSYDLRPSYHWGGGSERIINLNDKHSDLFLPVYEIMARIDYRLTGNQTLYGRRVSVEEF